MFKISDSLLQFQKVKMEHCRRFSTNVYDYTKREKISISTVNNISNALDTDFLREKYV